MGVGLGFLRKNPDTGAWEGDYELVGWGTFGELEDLLLRKPLLFFLSDYEEDYEIDFDAPGPPYPATVKPKLAEEIEEWLSLFASSILEHLRSIPDEEVEAPARRLKSLVERRLSEGYAVLVSY